MTRRVPNIGATRRLAIALAILVLLPAIFYSAYEVSTLSRSEELLGEIYRQQLDAILFSVNQYAWDVAGSWMNAITLAIPSGRDRDDGRLQDFLRANPSISGIFFTDSSLSFISTFTNTDSLTPDRKHILHSLQQEADVVHRLYRFEAAGYRKVEAIPVNVDSGQSMFALLAVGEARDSQQPLIGILIQPDRFVREMLGNRLGEAASTNFLLWVQHTPTARVVYSTGSDVPADMRQSKNLWVFPDYSVGIRLRGATIEEVVQDRFRHNLLLIGVLDLVLLLGVWFVYRTVRREMELAQMKSDFVSNVSHELKTPLALIRMFGETLQMNRTPSEAKKAEYYDTIVQESERLTRLVNNILNFSRMEAGKKEYRFTDLSLSDLVEGVVKMYHSHLTQEGFAVTTDLTPSLPYVSADAESVSEALLNIIDNAIKYSASEKWIKISTGQTDSAIFVEVEDHGIGIGIVHQKRIFEKFYRASNSLVHNTKGSGLGLTLVRHIMDAHGGTVTVKSTPGAGSTFRLSFLRHRHA
jgi:two-component system, OmpR family, phosphate regulon sensor histidine kinase PhoR